jgi:hypothetical protein
LGFSRSTTIRSSAKESQGPHNYRSRVMACNNSGVWNEAGTSLDFSIAPAYYQTNWFRALMAASVLAMLWGLYRLRLYQIAREFVAQTRFSRSAFPKGLFPVSAFPVPALGREGNLGRNTFDGPGLAQVNVNVVKTIHIPWFIGEEGATIEIRSEIFNVLNRVNLNNPISDLSSGLFGLSTSQKSPRAAQFGLRIAF